MAAEEFRANLGESLEILVTGQKRGDFHHVADSHAGVGQHRENVLPYQLGLLLDGGGNRAVGAHPDLARHAEPARSGRHLDAVGIRTDRGCDGTGVVHVQHVCLPAIADRLILLAARGAARYHTGLPSSKDPGPDMDTRAAAAVLALSLCGCAIFSETHGIQEVDNWVRSHEPLAESGKMKWSDFYAQYLERVSAAPVISQGPVVERLGIMITAALLYERGRIDRARFDSVRSIVRKYQTLDDPAANLLARSALVRALGSEPDR